MGKRKRRHPNYRLVKIHRNYTVEEIASLFGIHENTVRAWLKVGLAPIDKSRPTLVHGQGLVDFLKARRSAGKRPLSARPSLLLQMPRAQAARRWRRHDPASFRQGEQGRGGLSDVRRDHVSAREQPSPEGIWGGLGPRIAEGGATHKGTDQTLPKP